MVQIRTPDQRLRVFVSSTMNELAEERAAAKRAIGRLHLTPICSSSELGPIRPATSTSLPQTERGVHRDLWSAVRLDRTGALDLRVGGRVRRRGQQAKTGVRPLPRTGSRSTRGRDVFAGAVLIRLAAASQARRLRRLYIPKS